MTTLVVVAAVIERDGCFLITRRQKGVHLEGYWEFAGGKCEPGETHRACLARELHEELAVDVHVGDLMLSTAHDYADRRVELHFYRCELIGTPAPQLGQEMQWAARGDLPALRFPAADEALIRLIAG